jgi:hypothetical protein
VWNGKNHKDGGSEATEELPDDTAAEEEEATVAVEFDLSLAAAAVGVRWVAALFLSAWAMRIRIGFDIRKSSCSNDRTPAFLSARVSEDVNWGM